MENSILKSVKKTLGVSADYTVFDQDIIMHINSTFATLNQLGVGPEDGFSIEDDGDEWADFLGDDLRLNFARTYMFLKVKLVFDPPATGYVLTSHEKMISELEWRLNSVVDFQEV